MEANFLHVEGLTVKQRMVYDILFLIRKEVTS